MTPSDDSPPPDQVAAEDPGQRTLERALDLVRFLREHCSWDAEQTPESLIPYLLEETHEVVEAIHDEDADELEGELGDLLLNLAFQVVIGEERRAFTAETITARLEAKMRARHPHLFGLGERDSWEALKARERPNRGALEGIARGLDPLTKANRVQQRASAVGFDWDDYRGAFEKVEEELEEVRSALSEGTEDAQAEELGDLLFAVVNLVRLAGSHPTTVLERANRKFQGRFRLLEERAAERCLDLAEAGLEALDVLWDEIKAEET